MYTEQSQVRVSSLAYLSSVHLFADSKELIEGPLVPCLPLDGEQGDDWVVLHEEELTPEGAVESSGGRVGIWQQAQSDEVILFHRFVCTEVLHTPQTFLWETS